MKYYNHADVERNKNNFFMKDIKLKTDNQFCRMEAHQQSGITEKRRKESTEKGNYASTAGTEKMNRSNSHL